MSALEVSVVSSAVDPAGSNRWCWFLLDHLTELATLAWYLVADGRLVEEAFARSIPQLERIPFDFSPPALAYNQARDVIIAQSIAVLKEESRQKDAGPIATSIFPADFPDLARLAFMLRLVILRSEEEVARLLAVPPSKVRELVKDAIHYISSTASCPGEANCPEA